MVTAHEADILFMRNFSEEITKNQYNQGGLTLKDLKPDVFESNEKSKLSFRQWSDEFSSWVERIDQDFEKMFWLHRCKSGTRTSSLTKLSKDIDWELKRSPSLTNTSTLR